MGGCFLCQSTAKTTTMRLIIAVSFITSSAYEDRNKIWSKFNGISTTLEGILTQGSLADDFRGSLNLTLEILKKFLMRGNADGRN